MRDHVARDLGRPGRGAAALALVGLLWRAWTLLGPGGRELAGAARAAESVVRVRNFNALRPWSRSHGSGFVWDREGRIVTNHHVVEGATVLAVQFAGGEECRARVVGDSPECDLALLELVDCSRPRKATPLGLAGREPRLGDRVATVGHPGTWSGMMAEGVVAGVGHRASRTFSKLEPGGGLRRFLRRCDVDGVVLSTASVGPGSSGGPLLSPGGRVVGVSTWLFSGGGTYPRVTATIRTEVLRRVVPALLAAGEFRGPVAGFEREIGPARFLLPRLHSGGLLGVRAAGCRLWGCPSKEARDAGLRRFDEVLSLGATPVDIPADAVAAVQHSAAGSSLAVSYRRPGDEPGCVRRTNLQVRAAPRNAQRRLVKRWVKRGVRAYLVVRFAQMVKRTGKDLGGDADALARAASVIVRPNGTLATLLRRRVLRRNGTAWNETVWNYTRRVANFGWRWVFKTPGAICEPFVQSAVCKDAGPSPVKWNKVASQELCARKCESQRPGSSTSCCAYCSRARVCRFYPESNRTDALEAAADCDVASVCHAFRPDRVAQRALALAGVARRIIADE